MPDRKVRKHCIESSSDTTCLAIKISFQELKNTPSNRFVGTVIDPWYVALTTHQFLMTSLQKAGKG